MLCTLECISALKAAFVGCSHQPRLTLSLALNPPRTASLTYLPTLILPNFYPTFPLDPTRFFSPVKRSLCFYSRLRERLEAINSSIACLYLQTPARLPKRHRRKTRLKKERRTRREVSTDSSRVCVCVCACETF